MPKQHKSLEQFIFAISPMAKSQTRYLTAESQPSSKPLNPGRKQGQQFIQQIETQKHVSQQCILLAVQKHSDTQFFGTHSTITILKISLNREIIMEEYYPMIIINRLSCNMIKYFRWSPLWSYLVQKGSTLPQSTINNALLINKNIVKGYVASKLYDSNYDLNYLSTNIDMSSLTDYDLKRVKATFEMVPANLTGLERYQVSLPFLYIESIKYKTNKYYEYLAQLCKFNKVDVIDLYILINEYSTQKCFQFLYEHLVQTDLPEFFIQYVFRMLLLRQKELSYKIIKQFMIKFKRGDSVFEKLEGVLRMKGLDENVSTEYLQKLSNEEVINEILNKIEREHDKLLLSYFSDGQNIQQLSKHLTTINTMIDYNTNISLDLKLRVLNITKFYIPLLPKRNVILEKVSDEEKHLKLELLRYQQNVKKQISDHIVKDLKQRQLQKNIKQSKKYTQKLEQKKVIKQNAGAQQDSLLTKFEQNMRYMKIIHKSSIASFYKWSQEQVKHICTQILSKPLYYIHYPQVFLWQVTKGIEQNYKTNQLMKLIQKFIGDLVIHKPSETLLDLIQLQTMLKKRKLNHKQVSDLIYTLINSKQYKINPQTITLETYIRNPQIYDGCQNIQIVLGNIVHLIGHLSNKAGQNIQLSLLSEQDNKNLVQLREIIGYSKRKLTNNPIQGQNNVTELKYEINEILHTITKTNLFEPLFKIFSKVEEPLRKRLKMSKKQEQNEQLLKNQNTNNLKMQVSEQDELIQYLMKDDEIYFEQDDEEQNLQRTKD